MNLITLKDVCKSFGKGNTAVDVLKHVNLTVQEGEMVAVIGKSGSGKSTLLNVIGGLITLDSGWYGYQNKEIDFSKQKALAQFRINYIGFILQYFALIDDYTVYQNVALPLEYQKYSRKEIKEKVMRILSSMGIKEKAKNYPDELSGGQAQRVAIARAIVKDPQLILADEPTGALDEQTEDMILDVMKQLNQKGKTIIIVTHDQKVANICHRTITIHDGKLLSECQ